MIDFRFFQFYSSTKSYSVITLTFLLGVLGAYIRGEIMNSTGFNFISNEAKKLSRWAFNLSKKMIKTCLKTQFNIAVLPVYFVYGGIKYIYQSYNPESEIQQSVEPSSETIVRAMRRLRNSVISGINGISSSRRNIESSSIVSNSGSGNEQSDSLNPDLSLEYSIVSSSVRNPSVTFLGVNEFSGGDLMWDVPVISEKADYFADCFSRKGTKLSAAKKALQDHPINSTMPRTRQEYAEILTEAKNRLKSSIESVSENDCPQSRNAANSNIASDLNVINGEQNQTLSTSTRQRRRVRCDCYKFVRNDKDLFHNIGCVNKMLVNIKETGTDLLKVLVNFERDLEEVISMREQIIKLEFEVDDGKKALEEVQNDRLLLREKLEALEKLINEEEKYFSDISYESGFYENENAGISGQR